MIWLTLSRDAIASPSYIFVASRELSPLRSASFQHAVTSHGGPLIASGTSFAAQLSTQDGFICRQNSNSALIPG
jgi:hypothetical protein